MSARAESRKGIVLFAAIALLALLGLLIAAAAASMVLSGRSARLAESSAQLEGAAEFAANSVLAEPAPFALASLPYGEAKTFDVSSGGAPSVRSTVTITRLRDGLLWIVGEAWLDAGEEGSRRINVVARIPPLGPIPPAPLVARGVVAVGSSTTFAPDSVGDPDCAAKSTAPRVAASSDSTVYLLAPHQRALLDSAPSVVHFPHDTTLGPGSFTGIMIADGSLAFAAPFTMTGLVVARGAISLRAGVTVVGALTSFDSSAYPAITGDSAIVRYSPCAVARELRQLLPPRRIRSRSWLEVL
jgi:hypothetical protein